MGFITKNPLGRMDDVEEYITSQVPGPEKTAVGLALKKLNTSFTTSSKKEQKAQSETMSFAKSKTKFDEASRAKRRALIFLESFRFGGSMPGARSKVDQLLDVDVNTRFAKAINDIRLHASQTTGDGRFLDDEYYQKLLNQPKKWLTENRLLEGSIARDTSCNMFYNIARDQFHFEPGKQPNYPNARNFPVVSIPAIPWNNIPGRGSDRANGSFAQMVPVELTASNARVAISTQFSGCALVFKIVNHKFYALHVMPDDNVIRDDDGKSTSIDAKLMAQQLAHGTTGVTRGNFVGTGPVDDRVNKLFVYGREYSNIPGHGGYPARTKSDQYMNIVGVNKGGVWNIYSQWEEEGTRTCRRIYPA